MNYVRALIEGALKKINSDAKPHHVEAWIRIAHGTLDHLTIGEFEREVRIALELATLAGSAQSERLAESYGLKENSGRATS